MCISYKILGCTENSLCHPPPNFSLPLISQGPRIIVLRVIKSVKGNAEKGVGKKKMPQAMFTTITPKQKIVQITADEHQ